jgi:hypothetical protein
MDHPTCGVCQSLTSPGLYEDDLWSIRHADPAGVPGWMLLMTKRHVGGPAHFDDREAAVFGVALRYATMPREAKAWSVFDLQRAAGAGEIPIDRAEVARVSEAYRRALAAAPRPW